MSRERLAYAVSVDKIDPIEGKDKIGVASFCQNGWNVIVSKEDFKPGDVAIYIEYDTVLPLKDEFKFLEKRCWREKYGGYVINAMKMAGVVSYGIAFTPTQLKLDDVSVGDDLTKIIGVQSRDELDSAISAGNALKQTHPRGLLKRIRYRLAAMLIKRMPRLAAFLMNKRKEYPYPIPKSDESRIEVLPYIYEAMNGKYVEGTLKLDGQSIGIAVKDGVFSLMSRNNVLFSAKLEALMKLPHDMAFSDWVKKVDKLSHSAYFNIMPHVLTVCHRDMLIQLADSLHAIIGDFGLQGELCGPGINKNPLGLKTLTWHVFNLTADGGRQYFTHSHIKKTLEQACARMSNIARGTTVVQVPIVYRGGFIWKDKAEIKSFVGGFKYENGSQAEGVVFRHAADENAGIQELPQRGMSNMASWKVISDEYALAHGG